jgi:4-hydroxybenzoate polyprenyltransferase
MKDSVSFLLKLTGLTLILSGIIFVLLNNVTAYNPGSFIWIAVAFFYLLTLILYSMAMMGLKRSQKTFTVSVLGSMTLRFIFSVLFLVIYLIINPEKNKAFIISFLFLYLFYTIFEIFQLVRKLRPEKSRGFDTTNN